MAVFMIGFPLSASLRAEEAGAAAKAQVAANADKAAEAAKKAQAKAARRSRKMHAKTATAMAKVKPLGQ